MAVGIVRLLIGDRSGSILAELTPDVGPISWRLNGVGEVSFTLPISDSKATESNLRIGNRVLVQFDSGLPEWGGVIDLPRVWNGKTIECSAYSGEFILGFRQTDIGRYFSGATVGSIYRSLILESSSIQSLGIELGTIWLGGDLHSPEYHFDNILDIITNSICDRLSNADFDVVARESSGKIVFTANLYERKGRTLPEIILMDGMTITSAKLIEQGRIVNWWDMAGEGNGWGSDRLVSQDDDDPSQVKYGLRQGSKIYPDVSIQTTLDSHVATAILESKDPHNMFDLTAVDARDPDTDLPLPGGFASYGIGDTVRVILPKHGFGGTDSMVRIIAREYYRGSCTLIVRQEL